MRSKDADDGRSFVSNARRAQIVEAAIETLAEVGYANTSLSRIAARLGISKGVISYHFAGKDDLIAEIVSQVLQRAWAYIQPRIEAQTTGPEMLRAYIESHFEFMRDNPNQLSAVVEIVRATLAGAKSPFTGDRDGAVHMLAELLTRFQAAGDLRADFDPNAMAIAIRAVIDAAPGRLADPAFDIDQYAREAVTSFDRATCVTGA
ncbi:MAG: TetR/AcrR family transcriptional regulator [Solirubrobacteraceae bacterium]